MKRLLSCFALLPLILLFVGCSRSSYTRTEYVLDTIVSVTIYDGREEIADRCFEELSRLDSLLSKTVEQSDVWRLNRAGGEVVSVSDETLSLIEKALYYNTLSGGSFDITVNPLVELWDYKHSSEPPPEAAIKSALDLVGAEGLTIQNKTVALRSGSSIDLGAIAKGYIADAMADVAGEYGAPAIINVGGSIKFAGQKPGGASWRLGVQKPFFEPGELICSVDAVYSSACTAGSYERYFEHDGKIYHHILDPKTGYPAASDLHSATVICDSAADADALSTVCFLLGYDAAAALIEDTPDAEAIFCLRDGTVKTTSGIKGLVFN